MWRAGLGHPSIVGAIGDEAFEAPGAFTHCNVNRLPNAQVAFVSTVLRGITQILNRPVLRGIIKMHLFGTSWGVIWRMVSFDLTVGAGLGFLYGPIAQLMLVATQALQSLMHNSTDAFKIDPGTLLLALLVASVIGLSSGALIGFIGGILAGTLIALIFAHMLQRRPDKKPQYDLLHTMSAVIGGLVTLASATLLNLPSKLAYLGADWVVIGWVLFVAIPAVLFSVMFWQISSRVIKWSADQNWDQA